ncbi:mpv17-like protein [Polypterus senegalus]|uniref:mpv17-like protein n=1 Tax=Polypterus senegalus TaxID=55291 RepID=UPI00196419E9|nr:mpv17-like protein [Polypterus senegalus]XP_039629990.1 mpv17-like protein [Polypterus senegalus]
MWHSILNPVRRFPWITNVALYGSLFAGGDLVHQGFSRRADFNWRQTRNVAVVAFSFHANFNYVWMRFLERSFPGRAAGVILKKVLLDVTVGGPLAISAFYTGVSLMEGKKDPLQDCREKFWNTYKTGFMYWPFMQTLNFLLVPLYLRTIFTGCAVFLWATFLCFSRQSGDGTAAAAFSWMKSRRKVPRVSAGKDEK